MSSKEKFILAIFITIAGGTILITSLVFGICYVTSGLYEDVYTFPVRLSLKNNQELIGTFSAKSDQIYSFWLKVPDRRIENQNFQLSVIIDDLSSNTQTLWHNNFKDGHVRNSSGQGQYYQLGTQRFNKDFYGCLHYIAHGEWIAPYNAYLVIRKVKSLKWPRNQIIFFIIGLIVLWQGINTLQKNLKRMYEESLLECKKYNK